MLLLDSPECDLRAVSWLLGDAGFVVTIAARADTADRSHRYDAAVVETTLDESDGIAVAGALLSGGNVGRIVFYTETTDPTVVRDAQRIGPVVDKESGPMRLLAALETGTLPVSHYPEPGSVAPPSAEPCARKRG